jgi:hypothetical protein
MFTAALGALMSRTVRMGMWSVLSGRRSDCAVHVVIIWLIALDTKTLSGLVWLPEFEVLEVLCSIPCSALAILLMYYKYFLSCNSIFKRSNILVKYYS